MDEYAGNRVADYFVIAGLPPDPDNQRILDDTSLEVNLKPSHNQVCVYIYIILPILMLLGSKLATTQRHNCQEVKNYVKYVRLKELE